LYIRASNEVFKLNRVGRNRFLLAFLLIAIQFYIGLAQHSSKVYSIKQPVLKPIELNEFVYLQKEQGDAVSEEDLLKPEWNNSFQDYHPESLDCIQCIYWGKISFKNESGLKDSDWIFYFGNAGYIDAYIFDESGVFVSHEKTGRLVAASQKNTSYGNRLARIKLNFSKSDQLTVYFRIESGTGYLPRLNFRLSSEDFYKEEEYNRQRMFDGLFIGFLLALLIFNLIYFFTTKDKTFLYQFLFVTGVLVFLLDIMKVLCDIPIIRDYPVLFEPVNFAALILLNIAYLRFVDKFIQLENLFPKWVDILNKLVLMNLTVGGVIIIYYFISLNERITDTAIAIVCAVQYTTLLVLLFQLIKAKDKKSYFILAATFFLIAGVIVDGTCVAIGIGVPIGFSKFVILGNVSFFFFGLAYRMKLMKAEEHEAIRLKENQELKNRLYTNITHEFRTPLTVIQGMVTQIESSTKISEGSKVYQAIELIKSNGKKLLQLVNTILDLTKLESGKMKLNLSRTDLIGFLRYSVQLFESYAGSKKIYLQFLTEMDVLEMAFDKEKMQQIVSNLISNAIKFTPAGGRIYFSVKKFEKNDHSFIHIEVRDTGEGIPVDELKNVFNRFFQVDSSKHKSQGSGLGLSLVKELVHLMEGEIYVESESGKGTTFKIDLPVTLKSNEFNLAMGSVTDNAEQGSNTEFPESTDIMDDSMVVPLHKRAEDYSSPGQEKPLLLLVDDNKDIIYYLQTLLENDYAIETAYNGKDGIALALEIIPDIIISDILMPDKDGYELCDYLKSHELTSHIPVVLLTAKADSTSRITGIKKGADAYLNKPFDETELKIQLGNLLNTRKALQAYYSISGNSSGESETSKPVEDAFLTKLNAIIQDKMEDEDFGILQLCRAMQMSRTQLHRKITALTGKSTSIYIRYLRLQKAKHLLKKPEMNISEIAFAVGFSDPNYFTRTFTEEFGITPSSFRSG
jgi:signal transduction histidine kinase/DNA-binding response OmpR family regulator